MGGGLASESNVRPLACGRHYRIRLLLEESRVAQMDRADSYDQRLSNRVIAFLQTRDSRLFPFTEQFDDDKLSAFMRDLRIGLSDLTESGAKRGTSASGFLVNDRRLHEIVREWTNAGGRWPAGSDSRDPFSALAATDSEEEAPDIDTTSAIDPSRPLPRSR